MGVAKCRATEMFWDLNLRILWRPAPQNCLGGPQCLGGPNFSGGTLNPCQNPVSVMTEMHSNQQLNLTTTTVTMLVLILISIILMLKRTHP